MPNRILKESICVSDSVNELSWFEEVFFYRLIVNCDDFGRLDARPAVLKAKLFPLKERVTLKEVSSALTRLADAGIVRLYSCDNKPYLYLPMWEVHQTVRAKKSKYPSPAEGVHTDEIICKQMDADVPVFDNRIRIRESESNSDMSARFEEFWKEYPKKVGKGAAQKAFSKIDADTDVLIEAVKQQKKCKQWLKDDGQYIPNPATWLNQERWKDEVSIPYEDEDDFGGIF